MNKRGLGKGLGALIPTEDENSFEAGKAVIDIKVTDIEPNENQPRRSFNDEALLELSVSIKEHGIVQPIIVRKTGKTYQIVAGERRWRASRLAGLKTIPAIVKEYTNIEVMEVALIENLQRQDLNPIEEAFAYKSLVEEYKMTQEEISKRIGKSRPAIANSLRLLNLHDEIKEMVIAGKISAGHARALLSIDDTKLQLEAAKKIIEKDLNVREIENVVKNAKDKKTVSHPKSIEVIEIEERLKTFFGTKVNIIHKKSKGKIEIEYYSNEELERLLELMEN